MRELREQAIERKIEEADNFKKAVKLLDAAKGKKDKAEAAEQPVTEPTIAAPATESAKPVDDKPVDGADKAEPGKSEAWAQIAKEQRKLRDAHAAFKREHDEFKSRESKVTATLEAIGKDPIEWLTQQVGDKWFETATQRWAKNGGKMLPHEEQAAALAKLKDEMAKERDEAIAKVREELASKDNERQAASYQGEVEALLAKPEFARLAKYASGRQEIYAYVNGYAQQNGELLQPSDAVATIAKALDDQLREMGVLTETADAPVESEKSPKPGLKPSGKTLTNKLDARRPPAAADDDDDDPEVVFKRAAATVKWNHGL